MTTEQIFNNAAQRNMFNWNLSEFKKTHPRLYKSIIESLGEIQNVNKNLLIDKIRADSGKVDEYKETAESIYKSNDAASKYAKTAFIRGVDCAFTKISNSLKS